MTNQAKTKIVTAAQRLEAWAEFERMAIADASFLRMPEHEQIQRSNRASNYEDSAKLLREALAESA